MSLDFEYLKDEYYYLGKFPIWTEYHIDFLISELNYAEEDKQIKIAWAKKDSEREKLRKELRLLQEKRKSILRTEAEKLDRFCKILCTTEKSDKEAEKEVYSVDENFYSTCEKLRREYIRLNKKEEQEERARKLKKQRKKSANKHHKKEQTKRLKDKFYLEKGLPIEKRDKLLARGYKRLKISPFGDSGAAYYWVKTRYNESKEHAFFCYLIEAELKKHGIKKVEMNISSGPDVVFERNGKSYCFDVETGKNMKKHSEMLEYKFAKYKREYDESYIFVIKKSLKYKYSKHGKVVTRSTLRKIISKITSRGSSQPPGHIYGSL